MAICQTSSEDENNKALTKALLTTVASAEMALKDTCADMKMVTPELRLLYRQSAYNMVVALLKATQNKGTFVSLIITMNLIFRRVIVENLQ